MRGSSLAGLRTTRYEKELKSAENLWVHSFRYSDATRTSSPTYVSLVRTGTTSELALNLAEVMSAVFSFCDSVDAARVQYGFDTSRTSRECSEYVILLRMDVFIVVLPCPVCSSTSIQLGAPVPGRVQKRVGSHTWIRAYVDESMRSIRKSDLIFINIYIWDYMRYLGRVSSHRT